MSTVNSIDGPVQEHAGRHALPDPGAPVPPLAWPTVGLFTASLVAFVISTIGYVQGWLPAWVTIPVNAAVTFTMFTVLHDAIHYAISTVRWVNGLFGRLAMPLVVPILSFPSYAFIHIEHHRHSNDDDNDPDAWASHTPTWQAPARWALAELFYGNYLIRKIRTRPKAEVAETLFAFTLSAVGLLVAILTGHLWMLAVVFLIPQRIGIMFLAWWFDWMPHHGLEATQRSNRYQATRARVGMEWLFTPLMLSQNYHLVHHLHPSVPFYRYVKTWRRNEEAYLERDAAISTVFGQQLNSAEFRQWKDLNSKLGRLVPVHMPARSSATHAVLHRIPVASVDPITEDSTMVTFAVPEALRDEFRFEPGQHVTVCTNLGGEDVRRNYSICAPATRAQLRIAVKHIPGGAFSGFVANELKAGDVLELMTPTGRFGTSLDPLARKHYVGLAVGSGITPVLSILETVLAVETESRFTLIYGNRTKESSMFRNDLDRLEARYADRLEILHVMSSDPLHTPELSGRIDAEKLDRWLTTVLQPSIVDEWFLCGPMSMSTTARDTLLKQGVDAERIHFELFTGYPKTESAVGNYAPATLTFRLSGQEQTIDLAAGDSILEGSLQVRSDTPYACMGGACGTCRAKLLTGTVEMDQNFALGGAELDAGYVLTCQSHPTSPTVSVDYDA
ncbi:2Fe-2S iron-sulfur cluster binding domain-containing protein [Mycobacterium sp. CBMA293]|uniref:fatty acid desaturase n=1 Tax=unclassified Mycolicibacterium TaxID=2636767 RepID=UPI0012DF0115|nr:MULTISPECIES: fatty acid desaturase [unclassified Mycolicibacterium]MUL48778.1 2Fe-2S iron-sulfur cluster binding domain-containing protein [Mycolicibacterium sp. CBMA 360]MUL62233.1 2Fe-2S iron-sulfur cluster binding domain-containing protein [Mycolicibacterium sp. CBMA 335]MUL71694.1 2Fe-2S iron-sulfur cluster binding domain-containing protein [Mycolicibacterium sp. CBMA 311]MUL93649.1 2Fe-2S iron-sulfur cluster binding domain-containing protein [Mycolicibacterium sp. CBMA 230]MUM09331.1 